MADRVKTSLQALNITRSVTFMGFPFSNAHTLAFVVTNDRKMS